MRQKVKEANDKCSSLGVTEIIEAYGVTSPVAGEYFQTLLSTRVSMFSSASGGVLVFQAVVRTTSFTLHV